MTKITGIPAKSEKTHSMTSLQHSSSGIHAGGNNQVTNMAISAAYNGMTMMNEAQAASASAYNNFQTGDSNSKRHSAHHVTVPP